MSSEEESFIILGDSPSLAEPYSLLQLSESMLSSINTEPSMNNMSLHQNSRDIDKRLVTDSPPSIQSNGHDYSLCNDKKSVEMKSSSPISTTAKAISIQNGQGSAPIGSIGQVPSILSKSQTPPSKSNLAESFLLGAIDCDTMKLNVFSNFPSLCTSYTKAEDIEKLQSLIQEHGELKENLQRSNIAMRQQFSLVNSWHTNVKAMKESHEHEINGFQKVYEESIRQNKELQQKVNELQQLAEKYKVEHADALATIETLKTDKTNECQQVTKTDDAKIVELRKNYDAEIAHLKNELSNAIGDKIAFEDIRQNYIDELNCLKVNLVATEELYKNSTADVAVLKSQKLTLEQELAAKESELKAKQDEIEVVKVQVDVYKDDFESERRARQELAGEKDQILSDLQLLQKRNQALIEEAQSSFRAAGPSQQKPKSKLKSEPSQGDEPRCPICSETFKTIELLEAHVHICLERSG